MGALPITLKGRRASYVAYLVTMVAAVAGFSEEVLWGHDPQVMAVNREGDEVVLVEGRSTQSSPRASDLVTKGEATQ